MATPNKLIARLRQPLHIHKMSSTACSSLISEGEVASISPLINVFPASAVPTNVEPASSSTSANNLLNSWKHPSNRLLLHLGLASAAVTATCSATAESETSFTQEGEAHSSLKTPLEIPGEVKLPKLHTEFGASMVPHPEKAHKGGEDAFFITEKGQGITGFGVADGVGGWASLGIDPSEYSRSLMRFCHEELVQTQDTHDPVIVLKRAEERVRKLGLQGSSTALVCVLEDSLLRVAYVGDSGIVVFRQEEGTQRLGKVYRSEDQLHGFNFPYQLGNSSTDSPDQAIRAEIELMSGDVVVIATDGVFDNLFDFEIAQIVEDHAQSSSQELADMIAARAVEISQKSNFLTPFGKKAEESLRFWMGGKEDDITVVVTKIA